MRRSGAVIFCCLQSKRCMHAGRAAPNGANFPKGKFQSFFPAFCILQKVGKSRRRAAKNVAVATWHRRKAEISRGAAKGFKFVNAKPPLRRAESRFAKPRNSRQGKRIGTFCGVQKVPQKHAEGCDPLDSRGRFKALSKKILAKFSNGTSRNRLFAQDSGEKALNRCEVQALQRKELKRTSKEQPYSLRTVGYGLVRMGCGGRKSFFGCNKEMPV